MFKSEISFERFQLPKTTSFEKTTIKTKKDDNKTIFFTAVYRTADGIFEKFFAEINFKYHYICGDFNTDILSKENTVFKHDLLIKEFDKKS